MARAGRYRTERCNGSRGTDDTGESAPCARAAPPARLGGPIDGPVSYPIRAGGRLSGLAAIQWMGLGDQSEDRIADALRRVVEPVEHPCERSAEREDRGSRCATADQRARYLAAGERHLPLGPPPENGSGRQCAPAGDYGLPLEGRSQWSA